MSKDKEVDQPYKQLGVKLRNLREKHNESLAEVSGAVEIDLELLDLYERGVERPSEDILLLLISHFSTKEHEADYLWQLAGYEKINTDSDQPSEQQYTPQPTVMVLPMDARIVYTDTVHVMANNHGVVMNFLQNSGPNGQTIAVSRVGMSRDHARSVLELLQQTLEQSDPKKISAAKPKNRKKD